MRDEIARLSDSVARDPAGMGWVALADALRRAGQLDSAERVATRGLARHPYAADGHDILARIAADGGNAGRARDEWEMAVRLEPRHVGALLGMSWLALARGDVPGARRWWESARDAAPGDPRVSAAARTLAGREGHTPDTEHERPRGESPAPALAPMRAALNLVPDGARLALVVDADGFIVAGGLSAELSSGTAAHDGATPASTSAWADPSSDSPTGRSGGAWGDAWTDALAAELSGLAGEAQAALVELQLGDWERLHVECEGLQLALAPMAGAGVALVATPADSPAGLPRLLLERTRTRAQAWMEGL